MKKFKMYFWTGLVWSILLFALSFLLFFSFSYMGVRDAQVEQMVRDNYSGLIILYNLKILLAYAVISLAVAAGAALLKLRRWWSVAALELSVWLSFWFYAVKLHPQLFMEELYNKGGLRRGLQLLLTDRMPLFLPFAFLAALVLSLAWRKKRLWAGALLVVFGALLVLRFPVPRAEAPESKQPNILIFGTDSLRPTSIGYNGYQRPTPALDKLFAGGANFSGATSSLARTFSSFTSLLTSTYPPEHGIRHMYPRFEERRRDWFTLTKILKQNGYRTGVVSDFAGDIFTRIDYGFDDVEAPYLTIKNVIRQRCLEVHYLLLGFLIHPAIHRFFPEMAGMPMYLDPYYLNRGSQYFIRSAVAAQKPFFLLSFSSNCHFPYIAKYPYYKLYTDPGYRGPHKYCKFDTAMKEFSRSDIPESDRRQIRAFYDGGVRLFDDSLADMLAFLEKSGLSRNTIVVILSDHGESLYEDGYGIGHGDHLRGPYSNTMTFGVWSPYESFAGRRIAPTVRDIDVAPTLLDMLNLPVPDRFRGRSLLPVMRGGSFGGYPAYMETELWYTPETPYIRNRMRMAYPGVQKVLELVPDSGEIILKKEFTPIVIRSKHRGMRLNDRRYIYMPGDHGFQEEWYIDEKLLPQPPLDDAALLGLKNTMLGLFNGKLSVDGSGRIEEKIE
ncbi:MAG: sulfatase-like hydrolase/transferase [Candidatus Aminicenantes bacterium]|nr:sulfatase-like hydrolase/transferase [Candidatus Aminicenantes bacterium]